MSDASNNVNLGVDVDLRTQQASQALKALKTEAAEGVDVPVRIQGAGGGSSSSSSAAGTVQSSAHRVSQPRGTDGRFAPAMDANGQRELFPTIDFNSGTIGGAAQAQSVQGGNGQSDYSQQVLGYKSVPPVWGAARKISGIKEEDAYLYDKADHATVKTFQAHEDKYQSDEASRIQAKQDKIAEYTKQLEDKNQREADRVLKQDFKTREIMEGAADKANSDVWKDAKSSSVASVRGSFPYASLTDKRIKAIAKEAVGGNAFDASMYNDSAPFGPSSDEEDGIPTSVTSASIAGVGARAQLAKFQSGYGGRFMRGGLYAIGSAGAEYAHAMEHEQMTGRPDYLSQGNAGGSAIGGFIGAGIGSLFPGYGTFIGAGVGMQLGGTIGQWSQVKNQQDMMTTLALQPTASMVSNLQGNFGTAPTTTFGYNGGTNLFGSNHTFSNVVNPNFQLTKDMVNRSNSQRDIIGANYWSDGKDALGNPSFDKNMSTVEGMAAGYQTVYQSMINAGDNPYDYTDFPSEGTSSVQVSTGRRQKTDVNGRPVTHRGGHWTRVYNMSYGQSHSNGTTYDQQYDRTTNPGMPDMTDAERRGYSRAKNIVVGSAKQGSPLTQKPTDSGTSSLVQKPGSGDVSQVNLEPSSRGVSQVSSDGTYKSLNENKIWIDEDIPEYEDYPIYAEVKTHTRARKGDWIRENAAKWFGAGSEELLKKVYAPINDAKNKTGDNLMDIIAQFGGSNAATYSQIKTPFGDKPALDMATAMKLGAGLQTQDRAATLAQLSVRDSGSQTLFAMDNRMALMVDPSTGMELIPGARDSIEYAKTKQGQIAAQNKTWQDYDTSHFNMSRMHLQAEEQRYEVSPYSPGNRMGMELRGLKLDKDQISVIQHRESYLKQKGMLSEDEEFQMESQIESLKTDRARSIGNLVDNVANRLPAMAAGRPAFANRIDSRQMTAMQFGLIDFPYRGAGALNDNQRRSQANFIQSYMGDEEIDSHSRTVNLNNGGSPRAAGTVQGSVKDGSAVQPGGRYTSKGVTAMGMGPNGGMVNENLDYSAINKFHSTKMLPDPDGKIYDEKHHAIGTWDKAASGGGMNGGNVTASDPTTHQILGQIAQLLNQINSKGGFNGRGGTMPNENPGVNNLYRNLGGGQSRPGN